MKAIYLRDVRCFAEPRCVPLAPLTLLVGENSTGKSSFLALTRIAVEVMQGNLLPNFNTDPFFLGAYDQVAHFRGGRTGRARSFEIGVDAGVPESSPGLRNVAKSSVASWRSEFVKRGSQPGLSALSFTCDGYHLSLKYDRDTIDSMAIETPSLKEEIVGKDLKRRVTEETLFDSRFLAFQLFQLEDTLVTERRINEPVAQELRTLHSLIMTSALESPSPYAIAPVRTKPERTYNPVEDIPKSEGSHVPMTLAKTYFTDRKRWERIKTSLDSFGRASGLFEELSLRTPGKTDSDPFQIMIKIAGPPANLIDVGYGVSQVLPVLVDLIMGREGRTYLLQQPEVHLHPRGQAQLGTFLAEFASRGKNNLLVETHSDYIIDRVRADVRDRKNLNSKDVLILFFERTGFDVQIHPIRIDENANLVGPPATYRQFFMEEEKRLLGI